MIKNFMSVIISLLTIFCVSCEEVVDNSINIDPVVLGCPNIKAKLIDEGNSILVAWVPVPLAVTYVYQVDNEEAVSTTDTEIILDRKYKKITVLTKATGCYQSSPSKSIVFDSYFGGIDILQNREFETALSTSKATDIEIGEILSNLNDDGTFSDVIYDLGQHSGSYINHIHYMNKMSFGYQTRESKFYRDPQLYLSITSAINLWLREDVNPPNWWARDIGIPMEFVNTYVLMAEVLMNSDTQLYRRVYDYMMFSWNKYEDKPKSGANSTDISKLTVPVAIMDSNIELLEDIRERVIDETMISNGEGIQSDFSFSQHIQYGKQIYLGTYGREYVSGVLHFLELFKDTNYQIPTQNLTNFDKLFRYSVSWMWYKHNIDLNQCGRGIFRPEIRNGETAQIFVEETKRLIAINTPMKSEHLKSLNMMEGKEELIGNKIYPIHDYMIHRGNGFMISSRMTSTRTVGNESGNGEGELNYHTGDGVNYIKVKGDEYSKISDQWSWKHLPGITVVTDSHLPSSEWGEFSGGGNSFASGASNGEIGVCGFIYDKDNTTARKSWFYFKDYFVALGAGIGSVNKSQPVVTTINQTLDMESTKVKDNASGVSYWNNDVGYTILDNSASIEYEAKSIGSYKVFRLSLNHGVNPANKKYAYAVYPNFSKDKFTSKEQTFEILSNTPQSQAILDKETGEILCVFYEVGTIALPNNKTLSASKACFVIWDGSTFIKTSPKGDGDSDAVVNIDNN